MCSQSGQSNHLLASTWAHPGKRPWLSVPLTVAKGLFAVRNFNSKTYKVNDVEGNPISRCGSSFQGSGYSKAIFGVDNYEEFVEIQVKLPCAM